jgi:hypothetical protein
MEEVAVQELTEVGPFGASAWMIGLDALTAVEKSLSQHPKFGSAPHPASSVALLVLLKPNPLLLKRM